MTGTLTRALGRRIAYAGLVLLPLAAAATRAGAQGPTPEGTVITNTATATYTDANGNAYTPVTASASVTVGFAAGVDASGPASVTPASPSSNGTISYSIANSGNGTDQVSVAVTAASGVTITGYRYNSTSYSTVAALNTALAAVNVAAGASVAVEVIYDVAAGQGGATIPVTLTAASVRTPATTDAATTNVQPPVAASVSVTPDGGTFDRLPSNGTQYSQTFQVTNNGNASGNFTLTSSLGAAGTVTIVSTNGQANTSGGTITLAAGAAQSVTVVYTVAAAAAAGATEDLRLTATSTTSGSVTDAGNITVRVVRAALTMSKEAFRDNQTTAIAGSDRVLPGDYIQYKITVSSTGGAGANTVSVSDPLPAQVTYVAATGDASGWTISEASGTVTASLAGALASGGSRFFWVRVRVK